jgi:CRP/FNR family transcriptional regulator, cyclic AMP receptor protein
MRFIFEENQELSLLKSQFAKAVAELINVCEPVLANTLIAAETDLSTLSERTGLYLLREGTLNVSIDNRELFVFEQGDAIFIDSEAKTQLCIKSDFATRVDFYSSNQIALGLGAGEKLMRCVILQQALLAQLIGQLFKGEQSVQPAIRSVKAGEVIIREGEISDQVFTLLEGHAQVFAAGQIVGEVNADELLGVIGALCDMPRIATVTASEDSLLMSLGKDQFIDLLSLRPHTVVKLIQDFARIISTTNQELLALKKSV